MCVLSFGNSIWVIIRKRSKIGKLLQGSVLERELNKKNKSASFGHDRSYYWVTSTRAHEHIIDMSTDKSRENRVIFCAFVLLCFCARTRVLVCKKTWVKKKFSASFDSVMHWHYWVTRTSTRTRTHEHTHIRTRFALLKFQSNLSNGMVDIFFFFTCKPYNF